MDEETTSQADGKTVEKHEGQPVVTVDRIERSQYIVDRCELCGETHRHGAVENYSVGDLYHRSAHCTGGDGYYLKIEEESLE